MFEKHVVDELVWWLCLWWFSDGSCCCYEIIFESLVNFELRQNNVWLMSFEHFGVYVCVHDL